MTDAAVKAHSGVFTPAEFAENYCKAGESKCAMPFLKTLLLAVLAGIFVSLAGALANTASHAITNASAAKIISGALFPSGLFMIVMTGAELFTGNCLFVIPLLGKRVRLSAAVRNLLIVYTGNFIGSILVAMACAHSGQLQLSEGALAVHTIKLAAAKCVLPFGNAFVSAVLANILVCAGVMCAAVSKSASGKAVGAFIPVSLFVICGFEHCVANMYFVPAGLFAMKVPEYAQLAALAGADTAVLTWGNFLSANLLPVTLGNILGGAAFAALIWYCYGNKRAANT